MIKPIFKLLNESKFMDKFIHFQDILKINKIKLAKTIVILLYLQALIFKP